MRVVGVSREGKLEERPADLAAPLTSASRYNATHVVSARSLVRLRSARRGQQRTWNSISVSQEDEEEVVAKKKRRKKKETKKKKKNKLLLSRPLSAR